MRNSLVVVSFIFCAGLAAGCGSDDDSKCNTEECLEAGGTGGQDATGGTGGDEGHAGEGGGEAGSGGEGGSAGEGGDGGTPDTSWSERRPDECTQEQGAQVVNTNLFSDVFLVNVSPKLAPGFSEEATVTSLDDNMTSIRLQTDGGKTVTIKWPGVISGYPVNSKVRLEQNRDWTIVRKLDDTLMSAMFQRNGAIPGERLAPLPLGAPSLRFAMQCNMSETDTCTLDAVALLSGEGDDLEIFESGQIVNTGNWTVSNRSAMQTSGCPGFVPLRSLIWVEGRP